MTSPIEPEAPQSTQPKGIGSWLALFLVGQGLLCAYALYTLSDAFGGFVVAFDPSIQSGAMFKPLAVLESVAQFARALAPLYGFYLVYKTQPIRAAILDGIPRVHGAHEHPGRRRRLRSGLRNLGHHPARSR